MLVNIFSSNIFSMQSLTQSINKLPYVPGRVGQLGLFNRFGVTTTTIVIEERNGLLTLLPTKTRGTPASKSASEKRKARTFLIPHIPYEKVILPGDIQDVRAFGSESQMETAANVVNNSMARMRQEHEVTLEHLRIGAIKGTILDADGATVIYDLFDEFGITQESVDFELDVDATKVRLKCMEVSRYIEEKLGASPNSGVHALCSSTFFDALISHPDVEKAYERWMTGEALRNDPRAGFVFGGVTFEEYRGKVGTVSFIPDGDARFFPLGVPNLFENYDAPANFMETTNTIGLPIYAKQRMLEFDMGVEIHTQSNPLPICVRPEVLVRGHVS